MSNDLLNGFLENTQIPDNSWDYEPYVLQQARRGVINACDQMSNRLCAEPEFFLKILEIGGPDILNAYAADSLLKDPVFAKRAITSGLALLSQFDDELQSDRELLLFSIEKSWHELSEALPEFRDDEEIVLAWLEQMASYSPSYEDQTMVLWMASHRLEELLTPLSIEDRRLKLTQIISKKKPLKNQHD